MLNFTIKMSQTIISLLQGLRRKTLEVFPAPKRHPEHSEDLL
jgi:hypothetical protein